MDTNYQNPIQSGQSIFAVKSQIDSDKKEKDFGNELQFIGLMIENEEFFVPLEQMQEIIMLNKITYVPSAPKEIEGVINLRGIIVPLINLRKILERPFIQPNEHSRIIITKVDESLYGFLVDGITQVVSIPNTLISNQSLPGNDNTSEFVVSIANRDKIVTGIVDMKKIIRHLYN